MKKSQQIEVIEEQQPTQNDALKKGAKKTELQKKAVLEALESSLGVVSEAVKMVGIHRATFYEWLKNDPEFKKEVDNINETAIDCAETALYRKIKSGDTTAIIFYLKTKGKKRGYVEKSEVEFTQSGPDLSELTTEQIINLLND
jgi:hypothetical protein